jgi:hypothetical protein
MLQILEIPWDYLRQEIKDRGSYLLVLKIEKERLISEKNPLQIEAFHDVLQRFRMRHP